MLSFFKILTPPCKCCRRHQNRQCFSTLLLSNFGELVQIVASVSSSQRKEVLPDVVFCSPSATRFNVLSIQRCCSAYFVMHGYLNYCCLPINLKQSGHFVLATTLSQHCNNIASCHSLDILPFFQNILCKPRRRLGGEMPVWK